ncbi:MAG: hypothetical protein JO201_03600 [Verrucomicrobia bacterium]|nr:hypothetical protein [Verrucomicrobiota bacterium]
MARSSVGEVDREGVGVGLVGTIVGRAVNVGLAVEMGVNVGSTLGHGVVAGIGIGDGVGLGVGEGVAFGVNVGSGVGVGEDIARFFSVCIAGFEDLVGSGGEAVSSANFGSSQSPTFSPFAKLA